MNGDQLLGSCDFNLSVPHYENDTLRHIQFNSIACNCHKNKHIVKNLFSIESADIKEHNGIKPIYVS